MPLAASPSTLSQPGFPIKNRDTFLNLDWSSPVELLQSYTKPESSICARSLFFYYFLSLSRDFLGCSVFSLSGCEQATDLTLVPSAALAKELEATRVTAGNKIRLWNKGVDSEIFHPKYRSQEMQIRLSVMDQILEARVAFIGDGPYREDLEKLFSSMPAVFTWMLGDEELSQAYASRDVFVMPSESETLRHIMSFSKNR
ncbi:Sulfoquinovosyl transferase SQD2 [Camellia lanceoleosa]|uniref:Sulfoquinovosyl transferase SQD2 n=1 Tax=Camellia lanceoleosa TaxID=1840588 RepID=A0ACC0FNL7_9ERIC|nr:Sulfoquinovosyl transferase SQD2 [Camellia lanceoleosa]